jgi:hypothetical protein
MAKRLLLRLFAGVALTFAPVAWAEAPSGIHSAQDLFDTCADKTPSSQAACEAYVHATIQTAEIMHAASNGGKLTPIFCPGENMGVQDLVAVLRLQADGHPERKAFPAPTLIIGGGAEAYPCTKPSAPAATPEHRTSPHRTRRQ